MTVGDVADLRFDEEGDVDEHVVQLLDARLQPNDVVVSSRDVRQGSLRLLRLHHDLNVTIGLY